MYAVQPCVIYDAGGDSLYGLNFCAVLKREASGRINDLGLCYSKDLQPCDNWESQMAVKRAAALLSDPKLEDEGSESTSMRD